VANRHHGALDQFKLERLVIERSDSHVWIVFLFTGPRRGAWLMPGSVSGAFYAPWHSGCISVYADFVFCDGSLLQRFSVSIRRFLASRERGGTLSDPLRLPLHGCCYKPVLVSGCWLQARSGCDLLHACVELMRQELSWPLPRARSFPTVRRHQDLLLRLDRTTSKMLSAGGAFEES
jgi:hypothetical protein